LPREWSTYRIWGDRDGKIRFNVAFRVSNGSSVKSSPIEREQIKREVSSEVAPLHQISKHASAKMVNNDELAI